ncbi:NGFI-A binding protein 1 (EGR1 binding protein 1) [Schistosoma haematobium]|uniref:NGFI-A binding protein 1 (EGR1 binding protein 1) n=2 Tax=Schistosoma haematobium TaxID=6185 RepID=A0A922IN07_SCHHA|nr:NGFI-A binding protein 1 (EGR1 binding protein 1) [Schistosoma haematobium]KAH9582711.1 NGFI-A binding protein 1 (EGR1 binding protein 1) [Schistosoma haematobium]CAH8592750.1 unnamed protein product [Schistosoma haematobium]CAH8599781.1 unnamed protein product [Schistosoma haematobium]
MDSKRNLLQNLGELEVYLLLQNAKLLQYFDAFINHGGDDIQQLIDSLNDPKEFDQLIKIVEMDKKPLHVQRFKKALLQYSTQNITSHHNQQYITKEFQSNNIYTNQEGSSLNIDNNNNSNNNMFTNSNWCSLVPSIYSGLNQSSLINSLSSTQSILSNYSQNFNPLFNQWAILNNSQNAPMFQLLAMGISNQQHLITPVESVDRNDHSSKLSDYTHSLEQSITSKKCQQQEENIQDINETNQSKTQNNLLNSPILSRNNSPYSSQLSQHTILYPSPLISTSEEINLTGTITNSQINALKLIVTENLIDDPLKIRPSATLMKSDYLKLEIAITALLPYLPKFQIRKSNNSRNTNEQEIQEILKLPENDQNRINGLRKHSLIFGRTDSVKRLTRPLRHFEITINEITFRLVQKIPELITQREHLFHIARQIVNTMNYGLSVNQTGQVTWKMLKEEISKKSIADYKLSNSDDECIFEANEADYSNETLSQILLQLKLEMQDVVNKEVILRTKVRCSGKDLPSTRQTSNVRGDLDKLVNQLHKCITRTVKYIILLKSAENRESESSESHIHCSSPIQNNIDRNNTMSDK